MMQRLFLIAGGVFGLTGVLAGTFHAHGLDKVVDNDAKLMSSFGTGVEYQMYHALALLGVGLLMGGRKKGMMLKTAGWSFIVGNLLFSGALYALVLTGVKGFGMLAPLGGMALIVGWGALIAGVWGMKGDVK